MDFTGSGNHSTGTNIETIIYFATIVTVIIKCICIYFGQTKLSINLNAAIEDWLSVKDDEKTREIMRKYTYKIRILTFATLYLACVCLVLYILVVMITNVKQIFFTHSNLVDGNT